MTDILLYETTADTGGGMESIRLSTGSGYNDPSAPGYFEGRIAGDLDSVFVEQGIFSGGAFGGGDINLGVLDVANADGQLDGWIDYAFGQDATLKFGSSDLTYLAMTTIISGKAGRLVPSLDKHRLGWRSRMLELDEPVQTGTFAGTNSGSTGFEGTENDIKGQRKPRSSGILANISPVLVNAPNRVYAWNYDKEGNRVATAEVSAVRFSGSGWTFGTDYATAALLAAASPTQGIYDTCLAESMMKMGGSSPLNGPVTMDVVIEEAGSPDHQLFAANQAEFWLLDAGVDVGDISSADIAALNIVAPYPVGIYTQDETYRDVLDLIMASIAGWYIPDRLGIYRLGQINPLTGSPDAVPVATFKEFGPGVAAADDEYDLISIAPVIESGDQWLPAKEVRVRYRRNYTVMSQTDIAAGVTDLQERSDLATEWRTTSPAEDGAIASRWPDAQEIIHDTALYYEYHAEAVRDLIADIFSRRRREWQIEVPYDTTLAALLDIGAVMRLQFGRFGYGAGALAIIHGLRIRDISRTAELRIWL